jgi:hypothetical protein
MPIDIVRRTTNRDGGPKNSNGGFTMNFVVRALPDGTYTLVDQNGDNEEQQVGRLDEFLAELVPVFVRNNEALSDPELAWDGPTNDVDEGDRRRNKEYELFSPQDFDPETGYSLKLVIRALADGRYGLKDKNSGESFAWGYDFGAALAKLVSSLVRNHQTVIAPAQATAAAR